MRKIREVLRLYFAAALSFRAIARSLRRLPRAADPGQPALGVGGAHRYEPDLNPTYHDLARHYGVAVLPTRVRRPRDKAKAEVAVQLVERWILAALRHRTFFSLAELNAAVAKLLDRLNTRPLRRWATRCLSRSDRYRPPRSS